MKYTDKLREFLGRSAELQPPGAENPYYRIVVSNNFQNTNCMIRDVEDDYVTVNIRGASKRQTIPVNLVILEVD